MKSKKALSKSSRRRVLVTGGAGLIGSHLADDLVKVGFNATVLDSLSTGRMRISAA